jgi:DsbC/DsbD-like thiol-disulfide interchange protein
MGRLLVSCAGVLMLASGCTRTAPQQPAHSRASLVVEETAATPGSKVNVGIQFVTDSGWHIYWRNPGDSGEPPRIQWQLPSGVTAGELEWPVPMRLTTTAGTDFGYQGTTVLLSALQMPDTLPSGTVTVGGELRWLACHDICVPQSAHLEAPIRIGSAVSIDESARQLLDAAAARLPAPLPSGYRAEAESLPDGFRLTLVTKLATGEPVTQAEFFPAEEAQIDDGAPQQWTNHGVHASLTLKKSDYLQQDPKHLKGILVLNGRDAYLVDAPVRGLARRRSGNARASVHPAAKEGNHRK